MANNHEDNKELLDLINDFIQVNRTSLVQEWIDSTKHIESGIYEHLPKEDLKEGSELFLNVIDKVVREGVEERIFEVVRSFVEETIQRRIVQGLNIEFILRASGLHRDQLIRRLRQTKEFSRLSNEKQMEMMILLHNAFEKVQTAIAKIAHETAISELEKLKRFNENIITSIREGLVIEDQNGKVLFANPTFLRMLGYSMDELIGQHWEITVPPDQIRKFREEASKRTLGIDGKYDGTLRSKDGRRIPVLISARTLHDQGKYKGVLSVVTDITDIQRMQNELEESKIELERLNLELQKYSKELEEDNIRLREILDIQPVKEIEAEGSTTFDLDPSYLYLIITHDTDKAFRVFEDLVKHGRPGLCVTRTQPDLVRKRYSLEKTPIIWLTGNRLDDTHCIPPSNIVDLSSAVIKFLEHGEDGVVIIEGIEYLISQNNFRSILNLVQLLNDKVMICDSRVILPIDPDVLDPKEMHMLRKEVRTYDVDKKIFKLHLAPKKNGL